MQFQIHRDINYIFNLYSTSIYVDNRYIVTVYADEELKIEIHREYSREISDIPKLCEEDDSSIIKYVNICQLHELEKKSTLEKSLLRARKKISKKILSIALKEEQ